MIRLAAPFSIAILLFLASCQTTIPTPAPTALPEELREEFTRLHPETATREHVHCDHDTGDDGVSEIAIERTTCFGPCGAYTLRLHSDGSVEYIGRSDVKFKGVRRGRLDPYFFRHLARGAIDIGFFDMKDRYTCAVTDNPTVYVSITRNGEQKIIEHYAPDMTGPPRLRLLEETIDAVQPYITWTRM